MFVAGGFQSQAEFLHSVPNRSSGDPQFAGGVGDIATHQQFADRLNLGRQRSEDLSHINRPIDMRHVVFVKSARWQRLFFIVKQLFDRLGLSRFKFVTTLLFSNLISNSSLDCPGDKFLGFADARVEFRPAFQQANDQGLFNVVDIGFGEAETTDQANGLFVGVPGGVTIALAMGMSKW